MKIIAFVLTVFYPAEMIVWTFFQGFLFTFLILADVWFAAFLAKWVYAKMSIFAIFVILHANKLYKEFT